MTLVMKGYMLLKVKYLLVYSNSINQVKVIPYSSNHFLKLIPTKWS
jgi:hypothetical protein